MSLLSPESAQGIFFKKKKPIKQTKKKNFTDDLRA